MGYTTKVDLTVQKDLAVEENLPTRVNSSVRDDDDALGTGSRRATDRRATTASTAIVAARLKTGKTPAAAAAARAMTRIPLGTGATDVLGACAGCAGYAPEAGVARAAIRRPSRDINAIIAGAVRPCGTATARTPAGRAG